MAEGRFGAVIYNSIGSALDFTGVSAYSAQVDRQRFVLPNSVYDDGTGKYVPNTTITVRNGNNDFWAQYLEWGWKHLSEQCRFLEDKGSITQFPVSQESFR